jgi:predicted component of type VI protein secretion system
MKRLSMKTTVEVPDELYRRAKAEAGLSGRKLKDLVEEGLRRVLDASGGAKPKPALAELMQGARGVVDSGVADLGSNRRHLKGFGRDAGRHR